MHGNLCSPKRSQCLGHPNVPVPGVRPTVRGGPQEGTRGRRRTGLGATPVGRATRGSGHRPGHRSVPVLGSRVRQHLVPGEHPTRPRSAPKKSGPVVIEADELWSFVGSKDDVHWVWVALDADTRRVLAMVVGDRSATTARRLWDALPRGYRTGVTVFTDFLASYRVVIPASRHQAVGKDSGLTAHIERFWLTLRQRCARFVRKTLTFSKCPRNHLGALWYFIRLYNLCHH